MKQFSYFISIATTSFLAVLGRAQTEDLTLYFGGVGSNQAYLDWHTANNVANRYSGRVYMPSDAAANQGAAVHWSVDDEFVHIAVAARATGWLGFGISQAGGMLGADMALFTAVRPNEVVDAYALDGRNPIRDECQQDWELVNSTVDTDGGFLMFEVRRLLDTGDEQDRVILNDESPLVPEYRVIAAWGDTSEVGYHGDNRARGAIRFFGQGDAAEEAFQTAMAEQADGFVDVKATNHTLAPIETEYVQFCIGRQDLIAQGVPDTQDLLNIIGFEPRLTEKTAPYVHHFLVYTSVNAECIEDDSMFDLIYMWGPGTEPFRFPTNLGVPLFGSDGFQSMSIQIHYNNPKEINGLIDNSGVRVYYTSDTREFEVGVLEIADPWVNLGGASVGAGLTLHEFECSGACSSSAIQEPVTVIQESLHMHMTGVRIMNEQIRNNKVIRTAAVDVWDFHQSGGPAIAQEPFTIEPGDGFRTSCFYRNDENSTIFGPSSFDEMCIAYLYYYPRAKIEVFGMEFPWICGYNLSNGTSNDTSCEATYQQVNLETVDDLDRIFGSKNSSECSAGTNNNVTTFPPVNITVPPGMEEYFGGVDHEAYFAWYESKDIANRYTGSVYMPSDAKAENGAAVHWRIDEDYVYLAVAARATGWLGFGIAEAGGMLGADMVLFTASRPEELRDAHTLEERRVFTDDCQQDWTLVASNVDNGGFLMFEARRLLNTGDPQDREIMNDEFTLIPPHRVIAAWGDDPEVGFHGVNRARGAIRFFGLGNEQTTFEISMTKHADGSFELRSSNYPIKTIDTEYVELCFTREDLVAQGVPNTTDLLNVIGFEPILTKGSEPYVHHFLVSASSLNSCEYMNEIAYVWAPGEQPVSFPEDMGAPLFGALVGGFQAYRIQIHYNNPQLMDGVIDSSGVRLYYTETPRQHQVGVMQTGDPMVYLAGQHVGNGLTLHEFDCPGSCSKQALAEPVTAIREVLHMHKTGVRISNQQIRNNEVIRTGMVDVWEFHQNGAASAMQQPFTIQPGDGFKTSCYYRNNDQQQANGTFPTDSTTEISKRQTDDGPVFGISSQEEMCIAYIFYYPRATIQLFGIEWSWLCGVDFIDNEECNAIHQVQDLGNDDSKLNRVFGGAQCLVVEPTTAPGNAALPTLPLEPTESPIAASSASTASVYRVSTLVSMMVVGVCVSVFM